MCGISGFYKKDLSTEDGLSTINKMTEALIHRGPDGQGLWTNNNGLFLGHRRLAILDLSESGKQPMIFNKTVLTFNGEIYNYLELRDELQKLGHCFKGHSDTETLIHAFHQWGFQSTLERMEGMFALAYFDEESNKLFFARDRLGEKPLYYGTTATGLHFASEVKSLIELPWFEKELDTEALGYLFKYNYIPAPISIFKGLRKLQPAHFAVLDLSQESLNVQIRPYWQLPYPKRQKMDYAEALERTESRLVQVVKNQSLSDVPLGTFLSGGVDSTAITALLQANSSQKVKSFSIGFTDPQYDESPYAEAIAKHLGTEHTTMMIEAHQVLGVVDDMQKLFCEPFSDSSQLPTYLLSKLSKDYVTVILSGDGGDELFCGYSRYVYGNSVYKGFSHLPFLLRNSFQKISSSISEENWNHLFDKASWLLPDKYKFKDFGHKVHKLGAIVTAGDPLQMYDLLCSHWNPGSILQKPASHHFGFLNRPDLRQLNFIEQMMWTDSLNYLPDDIMVKVDRTSMAVSLETRAPFLDHRLYEIVASLPLEFKFEHGVSKKILRDILYKYVPRNMIERPKMGFAVPLKSWLRNELKEWASDLIYSKDLEQQEWLNHEVIKKYWHEHSSGQKNWAYHIWDVLMFANWFQGWMK